MSQSLRSPGGPTFTAKCSVLTSYPAGAAAAGAAVTASVISAAAVASARRDPMRRSLGRGTPLRATYQQQLRHLLRGVPHRHVAAVAQHHVARRLWQVHRAG